MDFKHGVLLVQLFFSIGFASDEPPRVEIEQGVLVGTTYESRNGRAFYGFTGIPYAKPPIGKLRFRPPKAPKPWDGILDATKPHAVCPQIDAQTDNETVIGDENCLFLNVYTPKLSSIEGALLPVMFYIHGGWFTTGSANIDHYGPKYLLDKDVILVTANYRLGPLGFLSFGHPSALPNNGLRDQQLAIQWVNQNIRHFGGDPSRITLFGHSSGAMSAQFHTLIPTSKDLIHGVIAQSGSALQFTAVSPHPQVSISSTILAGMSGCETYNTPIQKTIQCLKDVDVVKIIKSAAQLKNWDIDPLIRFGPVLEQFSEDGFLKDDPIDTIAEGKAADIPIMIGLTTDEGALRTADLFSKPDVLEQLKNDFPNYGSVLLNIGSIAVVKYREPSTKKAKRFYFGDDDIDETTKSKFIKMYSDATFLSGIDPAVGLHAKYYKKPAFYYLFGYKGSASMCSLYDTNSDYDYGVCHGDDLLYLFNSDKHPNLQPTDDDEKMIDTMVNLWTNFATYGNPTPEEDKTFVEKWKAVESGQQNYYHIKSPSEMKLKTNLYTKRAKFWRKLSINSRQDTIRDKLSAESEKAAPKDGSTDSEKTSAKDEL